MTKRRDPDDFQFEGFDNPTTTPIPDIVFDRFLTRLGEAELKALLYICRRTFGFKKSSDSISFNQFLGGITTGRGDVLDEGCGVRSRTTLSAALRSLEAKGIVVTSKGVDPKGDNATTVYSLRFRNPLEGVVRNPYHGGTDSVPGVVRPAYPQQTVQQETVQQGVVVALQAFGISARAAARIASEFPEDYVMRKLDHVQWLVQSQSRLVAKSPAGYLLRSIEDDYLPPAGHSTANTPVDDNQRRRATNAARTKAEEEIASIKADTLRRLQQYYPASPIAGTALTTTTAWETVLDHQHDIMTSENFEHWLSRTVLVTCGHDGATIAVPTTYQAEWLRRRFDDTISRALAKVVGYPVSCRYCVFPAQEQGTEHDGT